jgi:tetratricopeptide (TPR) repeat protein
MKNILFKLALLISFSSFGQETAEDYYTAAHISAFPKHPRFHSKDLCQVGTICFEEAMKYFTKAIELNPNYTEAYEARGILKIKQADFQGASPLGALVDYDSAIENEICKQYELIAFWSVKPYLISKGGDLTLEDKLRYLCRLYTKRAELKEKLNDISGAINDFDVVQRMFEDGGWFSDEILRLKQL